MSDSTLATRLFQESNKASLLEVVIGGEGLLNINLVHQDEGWAVHERPRFIRTAFAEFPSGLIGDRIKMNDLDVGNCFDCICDLKDARSRSTKRAMD
jgi:hypothetical protein